MATEILFYSSTCFNSLPTIEDAYMDLSNRDQDRLFSDIGKIFVEHKVEGLFGLSLLHNHFLLEENEILVNIGPVSVPWKTTSLAPQLQNVNSSAWMFTSDGITPYEFIHSESAVAAIENFPEFLHALHERLDALGLSNTFGIYAVDGKDNDGLRVEFTQGRANITLPFDIDPQVGSQNFIEAMWEFEGVDNGELKVLLARLYYKFNNITGFNETPLAMKKCKVTCRYGTNTGHRGRHLTTKF